MKGCKSFDSFPKEFKEYIKFIENYLNLPITIISIGPDREDTIILNKKDKEDNMDNKDKLKGYNKEFFNILLTVWHQYKYGPKAWITRAEYLGISSDSPRANYIANRNIIDQVEKVWWYSGKAWEKYRDYISGSSNDSLEQSGKLLADLWEW